MSVKCYTIFIPVIMDLLSNEHVRSAALVIFLVNQTLELISRISTLLAVVAVALAIYFAWRLWINSKYYKDNVQTSNATASDISEPAYTSKLAATSLLDRGFDMVRSQVEAIATEGVTRRYSLRSAKKE
jgi:TRAP-type C4-dicarboxylate transport system permease small subunit